MVENYLEIDSNTSLKLTNIQRIKLISIQWMKRRALEIKIFLTKARRITPIMELIRIKMKKSNFPKKS